MPERYRAWTWRSGSEPEALTLEDITLPSLAAGQALVRNEVIGLNPVDWKVLGGALAEWRPGHVPGVDGAGVVVAIGDGVPGAWLGQRVAYHQGLREQGSFAEYTPVACRALMGVPDVLDMETAASFPCPALTAWLAIEKLPAHPGARLLLSGAGGAVGQYVVQLAAARGWAVTTMSHPRHWEILTALGAAETLSGPLEQGETLPEAARFLAIIDMVHEDHAQRLAPALRANGHLVTIQGRLPHWPCEPFGKAQSIHEVALGALHYHGDDADWVALTAAGETMLRALAEGRLVPEAHSVRPFTELPRYLADLRARNFSGKPLIRL